MAITNATFRLNFHPLVQGPESPFPLALWVAGATLTGDASGGEASLILQLPPREVYSLDGVAVGGMLAEAVDLVWQPELSEGEQTSFAQQWSATLVTEPAGNFRIPARDQFSPRSMPLSLGAPFGTRPPQLTVVATNTNLVEFDLNAWGYMWPRRVLTLPGGPRRLLG